MRAFDNWAAVEKDLSIARLADGRSSRDWCEKSGVSAFALTERRVTNRSWLSDSLESALRDPRKL